MQETKATSASTGTAVSATVPEQPDPSTTTAVVQHGYDAMGAAFHAWARDKARPRLDFTEDVLARLSSSMTTASAFSATTTSSSSSPSSSSTRTPSRGADILELGCGAGEPVLSLLVRDPRVRHIWANDLSATLISHARAVVSALHQQQPANEGAEAKQTATIPPVSATVEFLHADMTALTFPPATLDAVLAFFSLFHLPRADQVVLLRRIARWLRPGGLLAFNVGVGDEEAHEGDFFGERMFWSGWGVEGTVGMVREAGLEVLRREVLEVEGVEKGDPDFGRKFFWLLARKGD